MSVVINGDTGISPVTASGTSALVDGMTVGRGGGEIASNTAVGYQAVNSNTTGYQTTAVGYQSLYSQTTPNNNTAVGYQAAYSTVTNSSVTAVGNLAAYLTTANGISAVGDRALRNNTTGSNQVAVGYASLYSNTTGAYNSALGDQALFSNTTASENTAVGYQAGYSNTVGLKNSFIGSTAGFSITTGSYNSCFGQYSGNALTTASHNTFIGQGSGNLITTGSSNTILGGYNGNQGGLDIRTASNYIVLSDGDGNPRGYWKDTAAFVVRNSVASNNALELGNTYTGTGASYGVKFAGGTNSSDYCISGDNAAGTLNLFNFRGNGDFQFNSGYGSAATAYGCRVWVNFNGTGTVAIRGSGNVSSITDNGTGDYTINFSVAMPDANYSFVATAGGTGGVPSPKAPPTGASYSTSSVNIQIVSGGSNVDFAYVTGAVFR